MGVRAAEALTRLDALLDQLDQALPLAKSRYQGDVVAVGAGLLDSDEGIRSLYERASRFDSAGLFHGGAWDDPSKLRPNLVAFGLKAEGAVSTIEALSELRMLSLATGRHRHDALGQAQAREFLLQATTRNLDLVLGAKTEESRRRPKVFARARRLFRLIQDEASLSGLDREVMEEIRVLAAHRPIVTSPLRNLVFSAIELSRTSDSPDLESGLEPFQRAVGRPTALARRCESPAEYRKRLLDAQESELATEAHALAQLMRATGMAGPYHAVILRRLAGNRPDLLGDALGLNEVGRAELSQNAVLARQLIRVAVLPETASAIYGLAGTLERGLLSRPAVAGGLKRLVDLDIAPAVREALLRAYPEDAVVTPNAALVAGTFSVLGQPLGIGQGASPTCQSARGISLWSLHAPNQLLDMIVSAARNEVIEMEFEGRRIASNELPPSEGEDGYDTDVDPVSIVLVPHLDRIYREMLKLASYRGEDPHKWVNPAMYGRWIPRGFASAIDPATGAVRTYRTFVRRFYATHHPEFNEGHELIYPNPVGLLVTDVSGNLLGPHAVSLQRVHAGPKGDLRAYFFNPNDEGRQDWGDGVVPTVAGSGEVPGESSLPFEDFVSRLYAFHYNPYEEGDAFAVPDETVRRVEEKARGTWGRSYQWAE